MDLTRRALIGLLRLLLVIGLSVFLPAWTIHYWQAWLLIVVLFVAVSAITGYLARNDPQLLERRLQAGAAAEKLRSQRIGQAAAAIAFVGTFALSAIDHRFGWSAAPAPMAVAGDLLVLLGLAVVFLVFKENTFTSATVEVAAWQSVVTTGPYSVVRHPMYSGAIVMMIGVPLALGSLWGLLPVVALTLVVLRRIRDEEQLLGNELVGYRQYRSEVRYRLLPFVW